jgi:hypothetical protein
VAGVAGTGSLAGCAERQTGQSAASRTTAPEAAGTTAATATAHDDLAVGSLAAESINDRIEVTPEDDLVAKFDQLEHRDALVLGRGTYEIDEPLTKRNIRGVAVRGQGMVATQIERTGDFPVFDLRSEEDAGYPKMGKWTFAGFRVSQNGQGSAPAFRAHDMHHNRFRNVEFVGRGAEATGNNLHTSKSFDWKFYGCHWGHAGDPEAGRGEIYMEENTNNFHFVNCKFERLHSYAILSDSGGSNHRISTTKFHGATGEDRPETPVPYLAGDFGQLQITNCKFGPALDGFLRLQGAEGGMGRGGVLIANNQFLFHDLGSSPAIEQLADNRLAVANNDFSSRQTENPAVAIRAGDASVTGNVIRAAPITVTGGSATITGNTIQRPFGDGIVVDADDTAIVGNRVGEGGISATEDSQGLAVAANVVRGGSLAIDGDETETAANVVR